MGRENQKKLTRDERQAIIDRTIECAKSGDLTGEINNSVIFVSFVSLYHTFEKQLSGFPVEALPTKIKPYIKAVSESLQVPVDMTATFVLAILSLCVQKKYVIQVKQDWIEPLNLYTLVVARPSERKSVTLKETLKPINAYVKKENELRKPRISEYKLKKNILNGRMKTIQDGLSKNNSKTKFTMQDAIDCQKEIEELEEVKEMRLVLDDVTPEGLIRVMKENNECVGIISAEGGIFGMMAGRYSNNTNIDIFLKSYSGEYYSSVRVGSGSIELNHPLLTILLAVQPQIIKDIMGNEDFRGRGLLARFLYSIPDTMVGSRIYNSKPVNQEVRKKYEELVNNLLNIEDFSEFFDKVITLSKEADKLSEEYNQWIEKQLNGELEEIEDWAGKLHGNTMRIAGIFHIVKYECNAVIIPLEESTMKAAIEVGKYYLEHSKQAFDIMGMSEPQDVKDAKYILSRIRTNDRNDKNDKIKTISKRELSRLCQKFHSVEEMEPGLKCLEEHGYIRILKQNEKKQGRPTETIYINPEYYKEQDALEWGYKDKAVEKNTPFQEVLTIIGEEEDDGMDAMEAMKLWNERRRQK